MTTAPTFTPADIPPNADPPLDGTPESTDLVCLTCGTPLAYGGRGRKPRYCDEHKRQTTSIPRSSGRSSGSDVAAALAQMDMLYGLIATGLMFVSVRAASEFADKVDAVQQINRQAFESDRTLARRIGGVSSSAAPLMFYGANAFLIGPPLRIAVAELAARRSRKVTPNDDGSPFADFADDQSRTVGDPLDMPFAGTYPQNGQAG